MTDFTNPKGIVIDADGIANQNDYKYARDKFINEVHDVMSASGSIETVTTALKGSIGDYTSEQNANILNYLVDSFTPTAITAPATIIMLGASNSDGMISGKTTYFKRMMDTLGYPDITFVDVSVGGRHLDEILENGWDPIKATYTDDATVWVVMVDAMGNDISTLVNAYDGYANVPQASLDSVATELDDLVTSIVDNGNIPILFETTARNYDVNGVSSLEDESLGSLPFQQNILYPYVKTMSPNQYWQLDNRPYFQIYTISYNNSLLESTDGIHWSAVGYELLRRYVCDDLVNRITGSRPIETTKLTYEEASARVKTPQSVLFGESDQTPTQPHSYIVGGNYWRISADNDNVNLAPISGYDPCSVCISSTANVLTHGSNSAYTDDGDYTPTLNNYLIRQLYGYTSSTDVLDLFTISGLEPNSTVSVGMAAFKDGTENRISEFVFNGNESCQCNAKTDSGSNVVYTDVVVDSNGEIAVTMQKISGTYAHWNGTHIIV